MRYIELSETEKETLKELHKNHKNQRTRVRGHMLLLSADSFKLDEIARIHQVQRDTVSQCFKNWERQGIVGLYDEQKPGRARKLSEEDVARGLALLKEDPRGSKQAQRCLASEAAEEVSEWTFKRALKRAGLRWKRRRRSLRQKRDEEAFAQATLELADLQQQDQGKLDLYYVDETGVRLTPSVPYGWQAAGVTIALPSSRSKRLNILGFCNRQNRFHATTIEGWVTSGELIACFDAFCETLRKATVVVIDNASIHRSAAFSARLDDWAARGLTIKRLPTYSPELNLIEIVWRFIKYQWLPLSAFQSYKTLKQSLQDVLDDIGSKYLISFA